MKRNSTLAKVPERERHNSEVTDDKQSNKTCRELQNARRFGFIHGILSLDAPCDTEAFLILHKCRDMHLQRKSGRLSKGILRGYISIAPSIPNLRIQANYHPSHERSGFCNAGGGDVLCQATEIASSQGQAGSLISAYAHELFYNSAQPDTAALFGAAGGWGGVVC